MSENRKKRIEVESVVIYADEVIVIEAKDRKRHRRQSDNEVAGASDQNWHRDNGIAGAGDRRKHQDDEDVAGEFERQHKDHSYDDNNVAGVEVSRKRRSWW